MFSHTLRLVFSASALATNRRNWRGKLGADRSTTGASSGDGRGQLVRRKNEQAAHGVERYEVRTTQPRIFRAFDLRLRTRTGVLIGFDLLSANDQPTNSWISGSTWAPPTGMGRWNVESGTSRPCTWFLWLEHRSSKECGSIPGLRFSHSESGPFGAVSAQTRLRTYCTGIGGRFADHFADQLPGTGRG